MGIDGFSTRVQTTNEDMHVGVADKQPFLGEDSSSLELVDGVGAVPGRREVHRALPCGSNVK
jgi:hypothetical protein